MTTGTFVLFLLLSGGLGAIAFLYIQAKQQASAALARYSQIIDLEAEQKKLSAANRRFLEETTTLHQRASTDHARLIQQYRDEEAAFLERDRNSRTALSSEYNNALAHYERLKKEIALAEDSLESMSFGLYQPHFTFQTPEEYKVKIELLRSQQKEVVRQGNATQCPHEWTVNNSKTEGKRMIRLHSKLMLRAFNGECDAAIANLSWNNANTMEQRVRKAFDAVNQLGAVEHITITHLYFTLRIEELKMTQEYEQKRYEVREEQRRIREQMREEEHTQREIDKALEESVSEEEKFAAAIAKARDEATRAMGDKLEKLTEQINKFEAKLDEARRKKERAIARAQLTKSGFVYVISNIGSFGNRVFKIGMTRRLEPMERIYELSGAAVPVPYDLHAMLYSDNAPALEHEMHCLFQNRRMNRVNARREFFQDVTWRRLNLS